MDHRASVGLSLELENQNVVISYTGEAEGFKSFRGHKLLANADVIYYEVKIEKCGAEAIAIGFAPPDFALEKCVGQHPLSYSYCSDGRFLVDGKQLKSKKKFKAGDTIGAGVDRHCLPNKLILRLNGIIKSGDNLFVASCDLRPFITLKNRGDRVVMNLAPSIGQPITSASNSSATYPVSSTQVMSNTKMPSEHTVQIADSTSQMGSPRPIAAQLRQQPQWPRQAEQQNVQQQQQHPNYMPAHQQMMIDPNMPYGSQQMMPMGSPAAQPVNSWMGWNSAAMSHQQLKQTPRGAYPAPANPKIAGMNSAYISAHGGVVPPVASSPFYSGGPHQQSTSNAQPIDQVYQHQYQTAQQYNYQQQSNMYPQQQQQQQLQFQQQQHLMQRQRTMAAGSAAMPTNQPHQQNMEPSISKSSMDDLLPVPTEQPGAELTAPPSCAVVQNTQNLMGMNCPSGKGTVNILHLPEPVQSEIFGMEQRFNFDPNVELSLDSNSFIINCSLKREQIPSLRLIVPRNYPTGTVSVERVELNLDWFSFDDLQREIYEQLDKQPGQGIAGILNIWDNTVQQFYSGQMPQDSYQDFGGFSSNF